MVLITFMYSVYLIVSLSLQIVTPRCQEAQELYDLTMFQFCANVQLDVTSFHPLFSLLVILIQSHHVGTQTFCAPYLY